MREHQSDPGKRTAQHLLATEVLELVHGREEAVKTRAEHQAMRNPSLNTIAADADYGQDRIKLLKSQVIGQPFTSVLHEAGLASSKSEATRLIAGGGVYVATESSTGEAQSLVFTPVRRSQIVEAAQLLDARLVLRMGKWKVRVIELVEDGHGHSM